MYNAGLYMVAKILVSLLEQGKLKTHIVELRKNGLNDILDGLKDLKEGTVSGAELMYHVDEV
jgi:hypothetical protein